MLVQPIQETSHSAHVVVLASEKGGSGKSTMALHIAVALLKAGQRVATIDLDGRQKSFTEQPPARNGIQSRTSRCKSMTSSAKVRPYRETRDTGCNAREPRRVQSYDLGAAIWGCRWSVMTDAAAPAARRARHARALDSG